MDKSRLAQVLKVGLARMQESKDQSVHLEQLAGWSDAPAQDVRAILGRLGLRSRPVHRQGERKAGYDRLALIGVLAELQKDSLSATQPMVLRDWGCTSCFHLWETTEQPTECPSCGSGDVKVRMVKAAAVKGERTKFVDEQLQGCLNDYGLTDYRSAEHQPGQTARVEQKAGIGNFTTGPSVDIGAAMGLPSGVVQPYGLPRGTGPATPAPGINMRDALTQMSGGAVRLPQPKRTNIVATHRD